MRKVKPVEITVLQLSFSTLPPRTRWPIQRFPPGDNPLRACHHGSHGQDGPEEARRGPHRRPLSGSARLADGRRRRRDHVGERSTCVADAAGGHALDLLPLGALAVGVQEVGASRHAGRRGVAGDLLSFDQQAGPLMNAATGTRKAITHSAERHQCSLGTHSRHRGRRPGNTGRRHTHGRHATGRGYLADRGELAERRKLAQRRNLAERHGLGSRIGISC